MIKNSSNNPTRNSSVTKGNTGIKQFPTTKKSGYSYKRGFIYLLVVATLFLIIPLAILWFIRMRISVLPTEILYEVKTFGMAASIVSFFVGYTRRHSRPYAGAILILIALTCAYFWWLLNGGVLDFAIQKVSVHLEFQLIMYWILAIGAILAIPYILMLLNPKLVTQPKLEKESNDNRR
jgi:hypothetical protein